MKIHGKRHTLRAAAAAAVLGLGLAGAPPAAGESPRDAAPGFPQIIESMMRDAHFGMRHGKGRLHGRPPLAARPLVSIALRNHEELKLTDAQVKRLKDIRDAFSKEAVKAGAEMKAGRIDLRRALDGEKVDFADVEKRMRKLSEMRVNLRLARLKAIQEGRSVLSEEQRKQLVKIARKRRGRAMRRMMRHEDAPSGRPRTY